MVEKEITYTEEVEKTEDVLVCDGCGVEVVEGENCITLLDYDSLTVNEDGYVGFNYHAMYRDKGEVTMESETVRDKFDKEAHFCFSCWSGKNLSLDEETATVVDNYDSMLREEAKNELREEWKQKSVFHKFVTTSLKTWFFFSSFVVLTISTYMSGMDYFWSVPAVMTIIGFILILTDPKT